MKPVRKKSCPYCKKKLQAKSKGQWSNNLARHLARGTCIPYEQIHKPRQMAYMANFIGGFLGAIASAHFGALVVPTTDPKAKREIDELEGLYNRDANPGHSFPPK